ncbi:hypothetical protein [uncultured Jatrophihabitans sp.]|uniref:hypothetical protein n=1 Tax=uncultured Jatrophihabitans sp. TaxID=1610747 RepID=UPI0035CB0B95
MAEPNTHVNDAVAGALAAVADESEQIRSAVAAAAAQGAANAAVPPPVGPAVGAIWIIFVSGLVAVVILTAALAGSYVLDRHAGPPAALVTVFTSTLSALVGLFVKAPSQR